MSIAVTDAQYEEIQRNARESNQTITDWILSKLPIEKEHKLTVNDVLERIKTTELDTFTLPLLLSDEWDGYTKGSKTAIGRRIFQMVRSGPDIGIVFAGKNSANHAIYKKEG